jgi:hypothetical protein
MFYLRYSSPWCGSWAFVNNLLCVLSLHFSVYFLSVISFLPLEFFCQGKIQTNLEEFLANIERKSSKLKCFPRVFFMFPSFVWVMFDFFAFKVFLFIYIIFRPWIEAIWLWWRIITVGSTEKSIKKRFYVSLIYLTSHIKPINHNNKPVRKK